MTHFSDFSGTARVVFWWAQRVCPMFFIRLIDSFRIQDAIFFILFSLLLVATQHRGDVGLFVVVILRLISEISEAGFVFVCFCLG